MGNIISYYLRNATLVIATFAVMYVLFLLYALIDRANAHAPNQSLQRTTAGAAVGKVVRQQASLRAEPLAPHPPLPLSSAVGYQYG